ncbi:MAG: tetratricopeptide repeat protein [Kiritimatiellae bacterium]|nr:tetratricopeptide repeat protein [Kiritimatiellia bacterium]
MTYRIDRLAAAGAALGLAAGVAVLFAPTVRYAFTNYDDNFQIVENPLVRDLSVKGVGRMFAGFSYTSYYPVRLLSFALNYRLSGLAAKSYHLTNVLLHAANTLMVFALGCRLAARRRTGGPGAAGAARAAPERGGRGAWFSAGAAALFAVHPVVVEPVAWVAGREELLTAFFALACVQAHSRAVQREAGRRVRLLWGAARVLCAAAACMSNVVGAVTPALLLAYDWCFGPPAAGRIRRLGASLARTWPVWALAVGTVVLKAIGDARAAPDEFARGTLTLSAGDRLLAVLGTYRLNLQTLVWPRTLVTPYANSVPAGVLSPASLAGAGAAIGTGLVLYAWRRRPLPLFGVLWFLAGLAPAAQLVPHHIMRADRFLYLPLAGLALVPALAAVEWPALARRWPVWSAVWAAVLIGLGARTVRQIPVWRDSISLFTHTVASEPNNCHARLNLGLALSAHDRTEEAIAQFREVVRIAPDLPEGHSGLATALEDAGRHQEALRHYSEALRIRPAHAASHANLGGLLAELGELEPAFAHFRRALDIRPDDAHTLGRLAVALGKAGRQAEAFRHFSRSLALKPDQADVHYNFGLALARENQFAEAASHFSEALRLEPANEHARQALAGVQQIMREAAGE